MSEDQKKKLRELLKQFFAGQDIDLDNFRNFYNMYINEDENYYISIRKENGDIKSQKEIKKEVINKVYKISGKNQSKAASWLNIARSLVRKYIDKK